MYAVAKCGCEVDVDIWSSMWGGCCCGECYNSYGNEITIDEVTIDTPCSEHGGVSN